MYSVNKCCWIHIVFKDCALDDGNGNVKIEQMCIQNISMFDIGDKFEYAEMPSVSG